MSASVVFQAFPEQKEPSLENVILSHSYSGSPEYACQSSSKLSLNESKSSGTYKSNPHWAITSHRSRVAKWTNRETMDAGEDCGETRTLLHCWWECKLVQPLWKTVWRFLKKWKIDLPYDPAIALLGICPGDTGVLMRRGTCNPMFIAALSFSFLFFF